MGYDLIRYLINRLFCGDSLEEGPRFLARIRDTAFNELDEGFGSLCDKGLA